MVLLGKFLCGLLIAVGAVACVFCFLGILATLGGGAFGGGPTSGLGGEFIPAGLVIGCLMAMSYIAFSILFLMKRQIGRRGLICLAGFVLLIGVMLKLGLLGVLSDLLQPPKTGNRVDRKMYETCLKVWMGAMTFHLVLLLVMMAPSVALRCATPRGVENSH